MTDGRMDGQTDRRTLPSTLSPSFTVDIKGLVYCCSVISHVHSSNLAFPSTWCYSPKTFQQLSHFQIVTFGPIALGFRVHLPSPGPIDVNTFYQTYPSLRTSLNVCLSVGRVTVCLFEITWHYATLVSITIGKGFYEGRVRQLGC